MPTVNTIGTIGGWAVVLAVAGSFYWVNNQRKNKNRREVDTKSLGKAVEPKKDKLKKRKDGGQSSGDQAKPSQKGSKKKAQSQAKPTEDLATTTGREYNDAEDNDVDNKEFARAMANAKAGTLTAPKSQTSAKTKSVKQTKAQTTPAMDINSDNNITAPSSTTGGDADDDQSPINSPEFGATNLTQPIASGDVSDMLEKPADAPSVLKITSPTNPLPSKQQKPKAAFEPVETKKQRQNRKKAEEKKLAREAEEKERQALMEKQRRTAREAEGRAAKDGSAFMAAQAPTKSAWTPPPEVNGGQKATPAKPVELLDTYEPTNGKLATKPAEVVYSESEEAGSQLAKEYAHMTEDEQMRKVKEDSAAWETVKAKGRKKATTKSAGKESTEDKPSSASEQSDYGVPPVTAPTVPGKKWGMTLVHVDDDHNVVERELEVQDSEWEVA